MTNPVILAIALRAHHLAIAVFDDGHLVYYRICTLRSRRGHRLLAARGLVEYFISRYRPDLLAIESLIYVQQQTPSLLSLREAVVKTATKLGVKVAFISPADVRSSFSQDNVTNKLKVAEQLVDIYPELGSYLNKINTSPQQYGLQIFNAVALGLYVLDTLSFEELPQFNSKSHV
jgi:hypothetical protein